MKFGHLYHDRLVQAGFPPRWIDSAISYNQLKKCIKRVRKELESLGLDAVTLHRLLNTVETTETTTGSFACTSSGTGHDADDGDRPLRYAFPDPATLVGESIKPCQCSKPGRIIQSPQFHSVYSRILASSDLISAKIFSLY
jgi:hypothetical protein